MRLVVCDDHRLLVDALTAALTEEGHEVVATPVRPGHAVEAVRQAPARRLPARRVLPRRERPERHRSDPRHLAGNQDHHPVRLDRPDGRGRGHRQGGARLREQGAAGLPRSSPPSSGPATATWRSTPSSHQVQSSRESADNPLWVLRFLTDREWEVMRYRILDGQTTEEMAQNLGVQRSTARTHVRTSSPSSASTRVCRWPR